MEPRVRRVVLKDNPIDGFYPYLHARIQLLSVDVSRLKPCALYVLEDNLERARRLRSDLLKQNVDILHLNRQRARVDYKSAGDGSLFITPPLVEVSGEDGNVLAITDGLHRVSVARELSLRRMSVILISGAAVPLPVLPVSWEEVKEVSEVPPAAEKRRFRFTTDWEVHNWMMTHLDRMQTGFCNLNTWFAWTINNHLTY